MSRIIDAIIGWIVVVFKRGNSAGILPMRRSKRATRDNNHIEHDLSFSHYRSGSTVRITLIPVFREQRRFNRPVVDQLARAVCRAVTCDQRRRIMRPSIVSKDRLWPPETIMPRSPEKMLNFLDTGDEHVTRERSRRNLLRDEATIRIFFCST